MGHPFDRRDIRAGMPASASNPALTEQDVLTRLLGRAKRYSIRFTEHLTGDGPTVFDHVCRMGLEGIVSKRTDAPFCSGPSKSWLKSKNPASAAVRREREEEWRYARFSRLTNGCALECGVGFRQLRTCCRTAMCHTSGYAPSDQLRVDVA